MNLHRYKITLNPPNTIDPGAVYFVHKDDHLNLYYNDNGTIKQFLPRHVIENKWKIITQNYTAEAFDKLFVKVGKNQTLTITLPSNPVLGDTIVVVDAKGNLTTENSNCHILRNEKLIMGQTEDLVLDHQYARLTLTYCDDETGWRII